MKPDPKNPNRMNDDDKARMKKSLAEFGDLSGIVINRRTDMLVGGHQRADVLADGVLKIKDLPKPEPDGTVARGYLQVDDKKYTVRVVDWDETKAHAALLAANRFGRVGHDDNEALMSLIDELTAEGYDLDLTGFDADVLKEDEKYTSKIESPIYECTKEKPPNISELCDSTKADILIKEINESKIPKDVKAFLIHAAGRHRVFDYEDIAEYYAHAPKEIQLLFEKSALVIIDYNKAIEEGYVQLSNDIMECFHADETT